MNQKVALSDKHLMIAVPTYDGKVPIQWVTEFFTLSRLALQYGFKLTLSYQACGALITNNRNIAAAEFMGLEDATHMLFIDSDILFKAIDVVKLLATMEVDGYDYEMIHVPYPLKKDEPEFHVDVGPDGLQETPHGLWRSYAAGCGFVMMKRSVIEKLIEAHPELFYFNRFLKKDMYAIFDQMVVPAQDPNEKPIYMGEDVAFFRRWKDIGGEMWCDPNVRLQHIGTKTYDASLQDLVNGVEKEV